MTPLVNDDAAVTEPNRTYRIKTWVNVVLWLTALALPLVGYGAVRELNDQSGSLEVWFVYGFAVASPFISVVCILARREHLTLFPDRLVYRETFGKIEIQKSQIRYFRPTAADYGLHHLKLYGYDLNKPLLSKTLMFELDPEFWIWFAHAEALDETDESP